MSRAYYVGGTGDSSASLTAASSQERGEGAAAHVRDADRDEGGAAPRLSVSQFRYALRHFLLNFTLGGQAVYKERIRNLDLVRSLKAEVLEALKHLEQNSGSASSQLPIDFYSYGRSRATDALPVIKLDLEHLQMSHWLPESLGRTGAAQNAHEDAASQISEEDSQFSNSNEMAGRGLSREQFVDGLLYAIRFHPLKYLPIVEDVVKEIFVQLLPLQEKAVLLRPPGTLDIAVDPAAASALDYFLGQDEELGDTDLENPILQADQKRRLGLFQLEIISRHRPVSVRELKADDVERLVTVPGIIIQASKPQHKAVTLKLRCRDCKQEREVTIRAWKQAAEIPRVCDAPRGADDPKCSLDPYMVLSDESRYCDVQTLKIQELPEEVPTGDMPRHLVLNAVNSLVNRVVPGERILAVGVFTAYERNTQRLGGGRSGAGSGGVRHSYIHLLGLDYWDSAGSRKICSWSYSEEEEFRAFAADPQIYEKIALSVAPAIYGLNDIKKSVACLLFGGARKSFPDGTRVRGDINILLLGDPSTAKSQMLKFAEKAAPIAVLTSGKGSSAAGLTAAMIKDASGNFALEGGAMVLADGGVVCIDEFDKMRDDDRVAIHEAMEQQTISIAKAGINAVLNTRCSVLAAANPSFGSYDDSKETTEQHDFETTILSRFDLIWLVRDQKDEVRDQTIAKHIFRLHLGASAGAAQTQAEGPIAMDKLRNYVRYARATCHPRLSVEAAKLLSHYYVKVRDAARNDRRKRREQIPITVRQLESLSRLAEAMAKMTLSQTVTEAHVTEAIRLFSLSTVETSKTSLGRESLTPEEVELVKQAERQLVSRISFGSKVSKAAILRDLKARGLEGGYVVRAIRALVQKGLLREAGDATLRRTGKMDVLD